MRFFEILENLNYFQQKWKEAEIEKEFWKELAIKLWIKIEG